MIYQSNISKNSKELGVYTLEDCDTVTFDLPEQYRQTDIDNLLHLKIAGAIALLIVEYDQKLWTKHT